MLNSVQIQGRLVADPELRHTPNGVAVATFRLAVERDYKDQESGERKADFITVVAWRQTGTFVSKFFSKGRMVIVHGRLQMRNYTDREGNKRTMAEILANDVYFGGDKPISSENDGSYNTYLPSSQENEPTGQFTEITDDDGDLPF